MLTVIKSHTNKDIQVGVRLTAGRVEIAATVIHEKARSIWITGLPMYDLSPDARRHVIVTAQQLCTPEEAALIEHWGGNWDEAHVGGVDMWVQGTPALIEYESRRPFVRTEEMLATFGGQLEVMYCTHTFVALTAAKGSTPLTWEQVKEYLFKKGLN